MRSARKPINLTSGKGAGGLTISARQRNDLQESRLQHSSHQGKSLALLRTGIRLAGNRKTHMKSLQICSLAVFGFAVFASAPARGWDYEGHRVVNQLALASLPTNFPGFIRVAATAERVAYLSGEPDRWRNQQDLALRHFNGPDHYIDLEQLTQYGLKPEGLPNLRYDFIWALVVARQAHPEKFPSMDASRNEDHTRELVGLLPWAITENYAKLYS